MPDSGENDARTLKALRDRIDDIDGKMHALLIERGTVIAELIRTKGTSRPGAAFRPMREAEMMRALVQRHTGVLPLATVEHIWREIITTFTHMQAPFDVAIDISVEPARMRDLARFVFGFSVEVVAMPDPAAVMARVVDKGDLGLVARKARGAWWLPLTRPRAPRIMAIVPFIETAEGPVELPAFVLSPPLTDETPPEMVAVAATIDGPLPHVDGVTVLATAVAEGKTEVLLAAPAEAPLADQLRKVGVKLMSSTQVGGFARGIAVGGASTSLYRAAEMSGEKVG